MGRIFKAAARYILIAVKSHFYIKRKPPDGISGGFSIRFFDPNFDPYRYPYPYPYGDFIGLYMSA